jgi:hypothetical protein
LLIATVDAGNALGVTCEVSDDEVCDVVEPVPTEFPKVVSDTVVARLPPTFTLFASVKTVVDGGSLGRTGVLPSAVLVVPVLEF